MQITPDSIAPATKTWFGNQMQSLAMRHDLAGPHIGHTSVEDYKTRLINELMSRAQAAVDVKELECTPAEIAGLAAMAEDLAAAAGLRIRPADARN